MKYLVSAKEMKIYDENTIHRFGIPALVLMERAALCAADIIEKRFAKNKTVLIAAGTGNNGGDGIALGRILWQRGYTVTFCLLGEEEHCSKETKVQIEIIKKYSLSLQTNIPALEYDIMVDAIFGIGLNRNITGFYSDVIRKINEKKGVVCALDIPSGICADTGKIFQTAVRADITITFAFEKIGVYLPPGKEYCGEILNTDIGITKDSFCGTIPSFIRYEAKDVQKLPVRKRDGNKGTFGKLLLIAGSQDMNGAAILAAKSAYRTGAGMVKILTQAKNREILQTAIPEALLATYDVIAEIDSLWESAIKWADVMAIGPGIGRSGEAKYLVQKAVKEEIPIVFDADAINILAEKKEFLEELSGKRIIFTPHVAEFSRLLEKPIVQIQENRIPLIVEFAKKYRITLVCKDAATVVSCCGKEQYVNLSGNDGMATAGTGDVLTGMIAALLAQGSCEKEAAMLGVYLHGMAGDKAKKKRNSYSLMASDIIEELNEILGEITDEAL